MSNKWVLIFLFLIIVILIIAFQHELAAAWNNMLSDLRAN